MRSISLNRIVIFLNYVSVGQAVSKKVEMTLKKTVTRLEGLVKKYNRHSEHPADIFPNVLDLEYINNIDEWKNLVSPPNVMPLEQEIAKLTHRLRRAKEEQTITRDDMQQLFNNRTEMHKTLDERLHHIKKDEMSKHEEGECIILKQELHSLGNQINSMVDRFAPYLNLSHVHVEDIQVLLDTNYYETVSEDEIVSSGLED